MKKLLVLIVIVLYSIVAEAHPGKTDKYGGHNCLKDCEKWDLYYAEYHLHDKDWKPIRVGGKKTTPGPTAIQSAATETAVPAPVTSKTETVTVYRYVTNVYEENIFASNPLLWALLVLLFLLLILRMNRKKEEG